MPFPLAHPAAVLPLRRFSPRWVDPAALVVGSIVPDTSYFLARWHADTLAHTWPGTILYAVPAGALALLALRLVAVSIVPRLRLDPGWLRLLGPARPLGVTLVSLWIGACTHVGWDGVTHKEAWLAQDWPQLMAPLFFVLGRAVRLQHLLWYLSSFGGLMACYWFFDRATRRALGRAPHGRRRLALDTFLAAALVIPIAVIHHLMRHPWGNLLAAVCTGGLGLWVLLHLQSGQALPGESAPPATPRPEPAEPG